MAALPTVISDQILELTWPPSVNKTWAPRKGGKGMYMTGTAKQWRKDNILLLRYQVGRHSPMLGELKVLIQLAPPRLSGDIDNRIKAILDVLQHARIIGDDRQIKRLEIDWLDPRPPGFVRLRLMPREKEGRLWT